MLICGAVTALAECAEKVPMITSAIVIERSFLPNMGILRVYRPCGDSLCGDCKKLKEI